MAGGVASRSTILEWVPSGHAIGVGTKIPALTQWSLPFSISKILLGC